MHRCYQDIGVNVAVDGDNIVIDNIIIFDSVVLIVVADIYGVVDVAEMLLRLWEDESFEEKTWLSDCV